MTAETNWNELVAPSPFRDALGASIMDLSLGVCVMEVPYTDELSNVVGTLHGGVIASMIDMAGALSGAYSGGGEPLRSAITLSFTTSFIGISEKGVVKAIGRKTGGGRKIFGASIEVFGPSGALIATGVGTYKYAERKK